MLSFTKAATIFIHGQGSRCSGVVTRYRIDVLREGMQGIEGYTPVGQSINRYLYYGI